MIIVGELFNGAYKSKNAEKEKIKINQALGGFLILDMSAVGAEKFGQLLSALDDSGQRVNDGMC